MGEKCQQPRRPSLERREKNLLFWIIPSVDEGVGR